MKNRLQNLINSLLMIYGQKLSSENTQERASSWYLLTSALYDIKALNSSVDYSSVRNLIQDKIPLITGLIKDYQEQSEQTLEVLAYAISSSFLLYKSGMIDDFSQIFNQLMSLTNSQNPYVLLALWKAYSEDPDVIDLPEIPLLTLPKVITISVPAERCENTANYIITKTLLTLRGTTFIRDLMAKEQLLRACKEEYCIEELTNEPYAFIQAIKNFLDQRYIFDCSYIEKLKTNECSKKLEACI